VNGDVLFDFDLKRLAVRHRASGAVATLALKPNPDPRTYGPIVTGRGGWVRSLAGRPRRARGLVSLFTGVHVLEPGLLDRLPSGPSDSVRDLYARLVAEGGKVLGVRVGGPWYDLGRPSLYLAAQLRMLGRRGRSLVHKRARVHEGAKLRSSVVGARSAVAAGAMVTRSVLWERVEVGRDAVVRDAVVTAGVRVPAGARIERAVVLPGKRGPVCVRIS